MRLSPARIGVLLAPTEPIWTGEVVSYNDETFVLEATTTGGALTNVRAGLALVIAGEYVRLRALTAIGPPAVFQLAENAYTFAPGAEVAIYNVHLPFPRYQRVLEDGTVYKDFDVTFPGPDAALPPLTLVHPGVIVCDVGETVNLSAEASRPMTVNAVSPNDYVDHNWDPGFDGTATPAGAHSETATVSWSTPGFRYLTVLGIDAFGSSTQRVIPAWVGVPPLSAVTACALRWSEEQGWQARITVQAAVSYLRQSPVAVVDLDTHEVLFFGFIWPASLRYNFERGELSFEAYDGLRHLYSYPFIVESASEATAWHQLPGLSLERALWFLVHWHSTVARVSNFNPGAPGGRPIRGQEFAAGSLQTQIQALLDAAFLVARGWRYGGVSVVSRVLFREAGSFEGQSGADLTAEGDLVELIDVEYPLPSVSEVRLGGFYYTGSPGEPWEPVIIRGPTHPLNWGNVAELTGLAPTSEAEIRRWASRFLAVENLARRYRVRPLVAVDPVTDAVADLPDGSRIAVEEVTLDLDARALAWRQELTGRTYGADVNVVVEPPPPPIVIPPPPAPPELPPWEPPLPPPELAWPRFVFVATQLGGVYFTDSFTRPTDPTQPTWVTVNEGLPLATDDSLHIQWFEMDPFDAARYQYLHLAQDTATGLYRREDWGAWTSILTLDEARLIASFPAAAQLIPILNRTVEGRLYCLLYKNWDDANRKLLVSEDRGASWALVIGDTPPGSNYGIFRSAAAGATIYYRYGWPLYNDAIAGSQDGGLTWAYTRQVSRISTTGYFAFSAALPETVYFRKDSDLARVHWDDRNTHEVLQDDLNLGYGMGDLWISDVAPGWQRVVRESEVVETYDGWTTAWTLAHLPFTPHNLYPLYPNEPDREEWMLFAYRSPTKSGPTRPHSLYVLDQGGLPNALVGKAGVDPENDATEVSIPVVAGGTCLYGNPVGVIP